MPLVDQIIIDCETVFDKGLIKLVKAKESYIFYNLTDYDGYYTINHKTCNKSVQILTADLKKKSSSTFISIGEGEYIITFYLGEKKEKLVITHYPSLLKSVIKDVKIALCNCDCDCKDNCHEDSCVTYKNLFGDISFLTNIYKTISTCKYNNIIREFITYAIEYYKCQLFNIFCSKELDTRIEGTADYSDKMFRKIIAIHYLAFYLYEKMITSPLEENVSYLNKVFRYKTIKECILKAGIDIMEMENLFSYLTYCPDEEPVICNYGCFIPVEEPSTFTYTFETNISISGIYHVTNIKNSCLDTVYFLDRLIYSDPEFKVKARNTLGESMPGFLSEEIASVNIIFEGTKSEPSYIKIPYKIDNVLINTYIIEFKDKEDPNRPPVITDIIKSLENRQPYTFTLQDFENHFTDPDGDTLDRIELVGDTSRFKLNGAPYISGTPIERSNITSLVYIPLDIDDNYDVILNWKAWDSHGLPSN